MTKRLFKTAILILIAFLSLVEGQELNATASCKSTWSDYTVCFDGSSTNQGNYKERLLQLTPAQIEGESCGYNCTVNMVEITPCSDTDDVQSLPPDIFDTDCAADFDLFNCSNGRCIDKSLQCNNEDDCGDNSDEWPALDSCPSTDAASSEGTGGGDVQIYICGLREKFGETSIAAAYLERWLKGIPGINKFANGFDILTGNYRSAVLDMQPHGSCRRVLKEGVEDEYYRLPANVASFRQINTISFPDAQLYENGASLMESLRSELRYDPDRAGLISELAGRVGLSQQDQVKSMVIENTAESSTVYAQQNVEVTNAEVTLQDPYSLVPSAEFQRRVMELPAANFSYDKYLSFVRDFGTHYVAESNLGGVYKQIHGYSRCFLEYGDFEKFSEDAWNDILPPCSKESFFYRLNPDNYAINKNCRRTTDGVTEVLHEETQLTSIGTVGGTLTAASNVKFSFGQETWDAWVESIKENPTLNTKKFKLTDITEIMKSRYIPMKTERRQQVIQNLKRAIEIYLGAYDAESLCAKCEKDGDYLNEKVDGTSYLSGTGRDYQCYCSYDEIPSLYTCGANYFTSTTFSVMMALLFTTANIF